MLVNGILEMISSSYFSSIAMQKWNTSTRIRMPCQQEHRKLALRVLLHFFRIYYFVVARAHGTKCAGHEGMSWRGMKVFRPPAQSDTVEQLTNIVILQGIFCDELSSGVIRSCPCFPMSNVVARLYHQTSSVLLSCGEPKTCAKSSFKRSTILPCGTLSFFNTGKVRMPDHYISVPPFHVVNITLWRLESRRVPHRKHPCHGVQNLILRDDVNVLGSKNALNLQVCGTAWRENFLSSTSRIQIIWESIVPYPEISGFCLTYQPVAAGYANMEDNTDIKKQGTNSLVTKDNENLLVVTVFPSFFMKCSRGQSSTYILSYTQGVLEVPNLRIQHFSCFVENAEIKMDSGGPIIAVYDWPIFPFGSGLNMERSLISKTSCSDRASADEFNSTTGDLSIIIFVPQYSHVAFIGTLSQTPLLCPGPFCNLLVHTVPNNDSIKCAMSSKTRGPQQRMVLSVKEDSTGYIFLSNFTLQFDGFTHYPCLFGGIFIYEFTNASTDVPVDTKSVSLLAKICSPWMAQIWNRGIEYSTGIPGLHFNVRPLLFVIKTYDYLSSSYLEGQAFLSNCAGVVNFLFNPTPREYNIPNRGLLIMPQKVDYNQLPRVRHQQGCLIIQNLLWGAEYNKAVNTELFAMNVTSIIKTQFPEHTIGISSNKYFAPFIKYLYGWQHCNLHAYPLGIDMYNLGTFRPPRIGYILYFHYDCLFKGDRPFVIMTYPGDEISTECLSSERTEKFLLADDEQSIYHVPITICAALNIKGSMKYAFSSNLLLRFNKPNTMSICCMLQVNINVKLGYLKNITQFRMRENYDHDIVEAWWKVWKLKHILPEETFSEAVSDRDVQLLGEGWKMSSLFGDVFLIVELARPVRTFGPTTNILNILFSYTFWKGNVVTMGKTGISPGVNRYCTDGGRDCYVLLNRDKMSWEGAKLICEKLGLALLSAPSDFEWKQFEAFIVHHKILHGTESVALAFLNLRYRQAIFFFFYFKHVFLGGTES